MTSRQDWDVGIKTILEAIERSGVEKVVLARRVLAEAASPIQAGAVLRRLAERFPQCTVFAHAFDGACFLGATPERLLAFQDGRVKVDCLAGSIARGADPAADDRLARQLLGDPKELREHAVVAKAIREALSPACKSVNAPAGPATYRAANVQHLHTPFRATAKPGHDIFDFVERLHPTPATGGYPRAAALEILERCEGFDRGWYAGPTGWVDAAGNGEFAVALRCALISGAQATLYAGCGIVAGSDAGREYEETALKLQAMQWALKSQD
jgi:isochorismate synthase